MKVKIYKYLHVFTLILAVNSALGQANPIPCEFPNVNCQNGGANGIIFSFGSDTMVYAAPGRAMPFWLGIGDTITNAIDTSQGTPFIFGKKSGPGEMLGSAGGGFGSYVYYNDIKFTVPGDYVLNVVAGNGMGWQRDFLVRVLPEVSICEDAPAGNCGSIAGNEIFAIPQFSNVIPVDAVIPIKVGVIDSLSGLLDSTFSGTIYAEQLFGPGTIYGTFSMSGQRWFNFTNLKASDAGIYAILFYEEDSSRYKTDIIEVEVVESVTGLDVVSINGVSVFPNPIESEFTLSSKDDLYGEMITIVNSSGQIVLNQEIATSGNQVNVNVESLSKGIYFVNLKSKNGVKTVKIIK